LLFFKSGGEKMTVGMFWVALGALAMIYPVILLYLARLDVGIE
jgi:hypothetical protein